MKTTMKALCLATMTLLAAAATASADTIIPGGNVSGTWTAANSPYIVQSNITVVAGTQLTIEPGVTVRFQSGTGLEVDGKLIAEGTSTNLIFFTSAQSVKAPGDWAGLLLSKHTGVMTLRHCVVEFGATGITAHSSADALPSTLTLVVSETVVRGCSIRGMLLSAVGSSTYVNVYATLHASIDSCIIYSNEVGILLTAYKSASDADIDGGIGNNTVCYNAQNGISSINAGTKPGIWNNTIWGNGGAGIYLMEFYNQGIRNNMVVSNATGIYGDSLSGGASFTYNDVWGNGVNWTGIAVPHDLSTGNISADPMCVNPATRDFHLKSQAGRYNPATATWVLDAVTSPCIDAGDPASAWANEPLPNRGRINMGAYGNTAFASKSLPLTVTNLADSGPGSLRQAIADAAPGDTIDFATNGTITLTNGQLTVTNSVNIKGPGATNLAVSGNNASRVLNIGSTGATVTISGVAIVNGNGGGIINSGNLTVSNCIVSHCTAPLAGGGIYSGNASTLRVVNSIISNNSCLDSSYWGGGIACPWYNIRLTVINSTISSNYTGGAGGAIMLGNGSIGAITNSTFSGNSGRVGGGIYLQFAAALVLESCTLSGNTSRNTDGGGILNYSGSTSVSLRNSMVAGNNASSAPDCSSPINSLDYNLIGNINGATITGSTTHNIYGKDPLLGPLADNGGPTPTHALLPGSPAIDHGSSGGLATDQRGQPRAFNFPAYFNADDGSDIGAVEMQEGPQTGPVFTVNSKDDKDDGVPGIAHCSLREAIAAANADASTNTVTINFASDVPGLMTGVAGTITLTNGEMAISRNLDIHGPGAANLTISGNHSNRIFSISLSSPFVSLSGLTLANGHAIGPNTGAGESYGGCIFNDGRLTILNCTLNGNVADEIGGAIFQGLGTLTIINSLLHDNQASVMGGAIHNNRLAVIVGSCIFSNSAGYGGGIWNNISIASMALTNCTVSGNIASVSGGGVGNNGQYFFADNCTICSNSSAIAGGGIALAGAYDSVFTIRNSIVAENSAPTGPDLSGNQGLISQDYNLIQNTNDSAIIGVTTHNIYNQDPKLGPLANLGGPTPTHALRFDSPALDAGHSGGLTTDQRGFPRAIDDANLANAEGGDGSDIGAYEADPLLRLTGIAKSGNDILLNFPTVLGRTYQIDGKNTLDGSWLMVTNGIPGSGGIMPVIETGGASQPQRYYRAKQLP